MSKKDAATAAGFSPGMVHNVSSRVETPEVRAAIASLEKTLLDTIPTELLVKKYREGLEANIVKVAQHQGQITDVKEFPDHRTRFRYLDKISLISGRYTPKTTAGHTGKDGGPIEFTALTDEELEQQQRQLERELGISREGGADGQALPPAQGGPKKD